MPSSSVSCRVGQGVGEAGEVVAFIAFALHRHGGGQAQHIEEHLGQVVVDVLHLARRQHAKVELRDAGCVAQRVGAGRHEQVARVVFQRGDVAEGVGVAFRQIEVLRRVRCKAGDAGADPVLAGKLGGRKRCKARSESAPLR